MEMIRYNSLISKQHPSHWKVVRNKAFLSITGEIVGKRANEYTLLSLTTNGVVLRDVESGKGKFPKEFDNYQVVKPYELVFCLFDIDETPRTVGLVKKEGMLTGAYTAFKVNKCLASPQFVYYYYLAVDNIKGLRPFYSGLRKTVRADKFLQIYIPLPPLVEQERIVSYLEDKTSKIDAYVAEKEKEILLLQELKQKTIADAVTKGLNPDVKMKESKTSLLGQIPEHWEERKIKYCLSESSEKNHPNEPVLCATQSRGVIPQSLYQNRVVVVNKGFEGLKFVKVGDFVISLRSFEGGIEYAYYQGIISAAYTVLTPRNPDVSDFFKLLFKSYPFIQVLQTCVTGIREGQNINYQMLGRKYIPIPPLSEQRAIVAYIEEKCQKIDTLMSELQAEIDYMKEYKQRLIADCVTGQVNVSEV